MDSVCQRLVDVTAGRPLRADARRNRIRLLEVAETVFTAQGVDVPIEEVARIAGVGVGTVYRHFPTKQDLVDAIVVERLRRLAEYAHSAAAQPDSAAALIEVIGLIMAESTVKKHLGADEPGIKKSPATELVAADLRAAMAVLLSSAQTAGDIRPDLDVSDVMAIVYGLNATSEYYGWDASGRRRAIATVFEGVRPRG
ncbi:TetR/AcrR family transcriptional regulator [Nocardia alni]|uniref:TetR/AcrR family transcriptional regulator n=1 Tax=Nocardia alni TaxID=2815723 RepID=UPI001C215A92|nr:helix-turn-helix domain-containing protein [Nocardia alni]